MTSLRANNATYTTRGSEDVNRFCNSLTKLGHWSGKSLARIVWREEVNCTLAKDKRCQCKRKVFFFWRSRDYVLDSARCSQKCLHDRLLNHVAIILVDRVGNIFWSIPSLVHTVLKIDSSYIFFYSLLVLLFCNILFCSTATFYLLDERRVRAPQKREFEEL